jgi:DNA-binding transcriptional LysR family regulator
MALDARLLRIVVVFAEELHFGRAARRLYLSQPALSVHIKKIESGLGVQLFRRSSRHVELTGPGRVFVDEARRLITHAEHVL